MLSVTSIYQQYDIKYFDFFSDKATISFPWPYFYSKPISCAWSKVRR